jgi:hypothetical protein
MATCPKPEKKASTPEAIFPLCHYRKASFFPSMDGLRNTYRFEPRREGGERTKDLKKRLSIDLIL